MQSDDACGITRRALFAGLAPGVAASAPYRFQPTLVAVVARFYTTREDKDWGTALYVLVNRGRDAIARVDGIQVHFNNFSENLAKLNVIIPATRDECERGSSVTVGIKPNGYDTWTFELRLELHFNDGQTMVRQFKEQKLDQQYREFRESW